MHIDEIKGKVPPKQFDAIKKQGFEEFRPSQQKAIDAGLLENKSLLICTPTASGKTFIAELAGIKNILEEKGKVVYICPLKALASEKAKQFREKYGDMVKVALAIGDQDDPDPRLVNYDVIICTSEKLDSLIRHHAPWIKQIATVIIDEIHLLNDPGRGPTLEVLITLLKRIIPGVQIIGLSATIGNPQELADWLGAELVIDTWRPVPLQKGVYLSGDIHFEDDESRPSGRAEK